MDKRAPRIRHLRRFMHYALAAGAAASAIGGLVLLGWLSDVSLLKSVLPDKIAMKPITAICFVLLGAALVLLVLAPAQHVVSATRRRVAVVCATLAAATGLATLCEYRFGVDLGFDRFFFRDSLLAKADPGRMAEATAIGFALLGGSLLLLDARHKIGRLCSELLALATLLLGVLTLLGYVYGIESLHTPFAYTPIAVHTAFLLAVLGLGVLFSRPESELISVVTSERGGGVMARRIMPLAVFLLIALAWMRSKGGLATFVASGITVLVVWVWLIARSLNSLDAKKDQALEELHQSEEFSRRILESSNDCIKVLDLEGHLLSMSRGGQRLLEIADITPYLNEPWVDFWKGKDRDAALQAMSQARKGNAGRFVGHCETAKGTPKWWDVIITPIADGRGNVDRLLSVSRDITERREAVEQLRLQSAALESAANAVVMTDLSGNITWANPAFTQQTGYSFEEVRGKNLRLLKSGKQDRAFYREMWETILSGKVWRGTVVNRRKDGVLNHEDLTITPIRNGAGNITHFVGIKQDITEKTHAQEALLASEVRYRRLFESAKDGILILDAASGQIVDVNPFLIQMLGYSKEELMGKNLWDLGVFKDVVASKAAFVKLQQQGYIRYENLPLETRGGAVKQVEFVSNSYLAGESRVIQCDIRDITGRERAEQDLRETNQHLEQALAELQTKRAELTGMTQQLWQASKLATMGELAASIAHELNNPLATVGLRTETLLMQLPEDPEKRRPLEIIAQEVDRMATLVNKLLQFSRRSHRQVSTIDPCEEIATSVDFVHYHLRSHNIEVVRDCADGLPTIQADRQQLRQLFLNLLTNASDAMPQGGVLTVRATSNGLPDAKVAIDFADSGEGINPENMEKIWDPFFTTKPEGKGTGLGLAICRRIVEEHGGTISIQSEGAGRGTTVCIVLPATDDGAARGVSI